MFWKAIDLGYLVTTIHEKNIGFSVDKIKWNFFFFNLTCQICNVQFFTKNENYANVLECMSIEKFRYLLKEEAYNSGWCTQNIKHSKEEKGLLRPWLSGLH